MLTLVGNLDPNRFAPRHYVIAKTDKHSEEKAAQFERQRNQDDTNWHVHAIPRSREVGQSYVTALWTTLIASLASFRMVWELCPDLILCNGPGTCVPVVTSAFFLKTFGIKNIRVVYVESLARVETLSLSGILLRPIVDGFLVQWPQLTKCDKTRFLGRLC